MKESCDMLLIEKFSQGFGLLAFCIIHDGKKVGITNRKFGFVK